MPIFSDFLRFFMNFDICDVTKWVLTSTFSNLRNFFGFLIIKVHLYQFLGQLHYYLAFFIHLYKYHIFQFEGLKVENTEILKKPIKKVAQTFRRDTQR